MKVKIVFTAPKKMNFLSKWIMDFEDSKFSHCAMVIKDSLTGVEMVYHASGLTTHCISFEAFLESKIVIEEFELEIKIETLKYILENMHVNYSFLALLGFPIMKLCKLSRNPFGDKDKSYICSEFVAISLEKSGYDFKKDLDSLGVTELYNLLKAGCFNVRTN